MKHVFHLRANTCILMRPFTDKDNSWKQCSTRVIASLEKTCQKVGIRASSGSKRLLMKQEARVFDILR